MIRFICILFTLAMLSSCGGASQPSLTANDVIAKFKAASIQVDNVKPGERPANSPLPNSYKEYVTFTTSGDKGAGLFVCDTKKNCDALYAYFDALKALAGPYLYQSPGGTVVTQLNSGLTPDEAAKFESVVKSLP